MPNSNIHPVNLTFQSDRLRFAPLGAEDVDLSVELWTNPEITRFVGGPSRKADLITDHPTHMRRCAGGGIGVWTLTTLDENEKIGTAILLPMPIEEDDTDWDLIIGDEIPDCDIEVGYVLKKSAWGKGYATEACRRMIEFAFQETALEEVVASIDVDNAASRNVLEKSGLIDHGMQRSYAELCPFFRITKRHWLDSR